MCNDLHETEAKGWLGIERIKPGHPQQNGRHERMHLALKKETTKPAGLNFLQQQARFDDFIEILNNERPHEALDMKCPAEVYEPTRHVVDVPRLLKWVKQDDVYPGVKARKEKLRKLLGTR